MEIPDDKPLFIIVFTCTWLLTFLRRLPMCMFHSLGFFWKVIPKILRQSLHLMSGRRSGFLIMGDINAKVGTDNSNCEDVMGKHGCGNINDNGEWLVEFCLNNNCVIGGTIFPHKNIHKLTWKSPDCRTINQIDHVIINNKWRRSLLDVKVCRGADVNSDHYMLLSKVKLKLLGVNKNKRCRKVYDINRLKSHEVRKSFSIELKNRFAALADIEYETDHDLVECSWKRIKESFTDAAKKAVGLKDKKFKKWLSADT